MSKGSVRKKGSRWYYRFYDVEGNRIERVGGDTKDEAERKLNEEINRMYKGYERPHETFLGEYMLWWVDNYIKDIRAENTYLKYKAAIENRINPALGNLKLCDLKVLHIETFIKSLKEDKLSGTTVQKYYGTLNTALNRAVKLQMIIDNPCKFVDTPKRDKFIANTLSRVEYRLIYDSLDLNDYYDYMFKLALDLTMEVGLRRGEMAGLTWDDIDFNNYVININKALIRIENIYTISSTKTECSVREVPISDELILKLRQHKIKQKELKLRYGSEYIENVFKSKKYDLVFTWEYGKFIQPQWYLHKLKKVAKKNEIEKNLRWHDLRHTNASMLLESGVELKVIQERLGHADIQTTANIYTHVSKKLNRDATNKLTSLLKNYW